MKQLVDIKRRLKAITGIAKITEAMQVITVVRIKKSQDALKRSQRFFQEAKNLAEITGLPSFCKSSRSKPAKIIVIGSNRGFCGSFNQALFPKLELALLQEKEREILALGEKIIPYLKLTKKEFTAADRDTIEKTSLDLIKKITDPICRSFVEGKLGKLIVVYNHFRSAAVQIPSAVTILPPPAPDKEKEEKFIEGKFIFEPSLEELQKEVFKLYVESALHLCIIESVNGELWTRMINMKNATDNSKELISQLTLFANKSRQASITRELSEISGAFEALKEE